MARGRRRMVITADNDRLPPSWRLELREYMETPLERARRLLYERLSHPFDHEDSLAIIASRAVHGPDTYPRFQWSVW